jgi:rsbT antagonist protein RsbS
MDKIPILKMGDYLLVSIQEDMDDVLALQLQDNLTEQIVKYSTQGVLIDISMLDIVDSFIGRMLGTLSAMSAVLGALTVVVGMQPAVAITITELGLNLKGIRTALNVEKGMSLLGAGNFGRKYTHCEEPNDSD